MNTTAGHNRERTGDVNIDLVGRRGEITRQTLIGSSVALAFGLALIAIYWRWFGTTAAIVWLVVQLLLLVARLVIVLRLTEEDLATERGLYWRALYPVGLNITAAWMGAAAAWVAWVTPEAEQQFLWLGSFTMMALTVSLFGVVRASFVTAPLLASGLPVLTAAIKQHSDLPLLLGFWLLMSLVMIVLFRGKARLFGQFVDETISLRRQVAERREAEHRSIAAEREVEQLVANLRDLVFRTDQKGNVKHVTPSCQQVLGYSVKEILGMNLRELIVGEGVVDDMMAAMAENGYIENYVHCVRRKDASEVWLSVTASVHIDEQTGTREVIGTSRDVTEVRAARQALRLSERKASGTLAAISDGVIAVDANGQIDYLNPVAQRMTGWSRQQAEGRALEEVLELREERSGRRSVDPVARCQRDGGTVTLVGELLVCHRNNGEERQVQVTASPIKDNLDSAVGVVIVLHDVTQMQRLARELSYYATHDKLTGLINRAEFEGRLADALQASQESEVEHTLLYMDLDQFKVVNDTCGHAAGDELLKQLASHLLLQVRESDILARLGGDEFGLLLQSCKLEHAKTAAENVLNAVTAYRFQWEGQFFDLGVSIGAVPVNAYSDSLSELLKTADTACYIAKDMGRGRLHIYSPDDEQLVARQGQASWVSQIQQALSSGQFELFAQPIEPIQAEQGLHRAVEFLIRLRRKDGEYVAPRAFLPAAERYHLMPKIDRWVIAEAFNHIAKQPEFLRDCNEFAINLSGQSLSDEGLFDYIVEQLEANQIDATKVCFEITETAVVANMFRASKIIQALRNRGCKFSLDDFGSGLSSFQYLRQLAVDKLKIDGVFIRDVADDPVDQVMVRSIVQVAHEMGIQTVAEFVANDRILERLGEIGVDYAQGFHVAEPQPLHYE